MLDEARWSNALMCTSGIYSLLIRDVTKRCYHEALAYFRPGSAVLDVGIGNGSMIRHHHDLIRTKQLTILGIDVNDSYLRTCRRLITKFCLEGQIQVYRCPIETFTPPNDLRFDYVFFSMSFTLLGDPLRVLPRVRPWLKPGGQIVFVHTLFVRRSVLIELLKPRLKYLTTIDFGRVVYQSDFFDLLRKVKLNTVVDRLLGRAPLGGQYRLVAATTDDEYAPDG